MDLCTKREVCKLKELTTRCILRNPDLYLQLLRTCPHDVQEYVGYILCLNNLSLSYKMLLQSTDLKGHDNSIMSAVIIDDTRALTVDEGGRLCVWDLTKNKCIGVKHGHVRINTLVLNAQKTQLLTAAHDGKATEWDLKDFSCIKVYEHPCAVRCAIFSDDQIFVLTGSIDGKARLFNRQDGKCKVFDHGRDVIYAVGFSKDKTSVYTACMGRTIKIWNHQTGECSRVIDRNNLKFIFNSVAFAPSGGYALIGHVNMPIEYICLHDSGEPKQIPDVGIRSITFSKDGTFLFCGSRDKKILLMEVKNGEKTSLDGHLGPVSAIAVSEDLCMILSGDEFGKLTLWRLIKWLTVEQIFFVFHLASLIQGTYISLNEETFQKFSELPLEVQQNILEKYEIIVPPKGKIQSS